MSEDERTKEIARSREKWLHDEVSKIGHARREGFDEGISEGITKEREQMIKRMRLNGMTDEQIRHIINTNI